MSMHKASFQNTKNQIQGSMDVFDVQFIVRENAFIEYFTNFDFGTRVIAIGRICDKQIFWIAEICATLRQKQLIAAHLALFDNKEEV